MHYKVWIGNPNQLEAWLNALDPTEGHWQVQRLITLSAGSVLCLVAHGENI